MSRPKQLLRPVAKVAEDVTGKRPSPPTRWRWIRKGCRGVRLNAVMLGGQWLCTEDDFLTFIHAQTQVQLTRTSGGVSDDELQAAGLL